MGSDHALIHSGGELQVDCTGGSPHRISGRLAQTCLKTSSSKATGQRKHSPQVEAKSSTKSQTERSTDIYSAFLMKCLQVRCLFAPKWSRRSKGFAKWPIHTIN